jgi:ribulose-5-phosphate 4-epimerase/fuculose-1-phosphate aldolase
MREAVTRLYKESAMRGLIVGSSGNVSARTAEGMVIRRR